MKPILLLTKKDRFCQDATAIAKLAFGDRLVVRDGDIGAPLPDGVLDPEYDAVISFISPWIVPKELLARGRVCLNFHPGSCDYPGIGCYNFALYEGAKQFGAVCHHMEAKVDTGAIVLERLFDVMPDESVATLRLRTMLTMTVMFQEIAALLAAGKPLPRGERHWTRRPFRRTELNELCRVTPDMAADEVARRVRAVAYPGYPGAYVEIGGIRFVAT